MEILTIRTWSCTGKIDDRAAFRRTNRTLSVTFVTDFSARAGSKEAVNLYQSGNGGIKLNQFAGGGEIAGQIGAIWAHNKDAGDITLTLNGHLRKISQNSTDQFTHTVDVLNASSRGGSVTLSVGSVTSPRFGHAVKVVNHGSGATRITATGEIHAGRGAWPGTGDGITVYGNSNSAVSKSLSVTVGTVSGQFTGMRIDHRGGGDVSVIATGSVQGSGGDNKLIMLVNPSTGGMDSAIRIRNFTGDSAIALSVATVTALGTGSASHAVHVDQAAQGSVSITVADGAIASAKGGHGVYLMNRGAGAVTLSVGTVTARVRDAVRIVNRGSGATRITATGEIHAGRGIGTGAGAGIAVSGDSHSAVSKSLSVTVGAVSGKHMGMRLEHRGGGDVSVTATGSVQGSGVNDNAIRITNHTGDSAIAVSVATVAAFGTGADAHAIHVDQAAQGSVSVAVADGAIVSATGGRGVYLMNRGAGAVTLSAATVSASDSDAVRVVNHGSGATRIMATGEIHASRGTREGGGDGIHVSGNSHSAASKSLSVNVGAVSGIYMGMRLAHRGGGDVSVTATGSVQSRGKGWGVNDNAIRIANHTGDSAITLSVATVAAFGTGAGAHAIHVDQAAQGSVNVAVADGAIASATGGFGVYLMNRGAGAVRLSVGTVTARARDAVRIVNRGSGATRITATGEIHAGRGVEAGAGDGVAVSGNSHSAVSKSLSVTVGTVSGKYMGMRLEHRGGGDVSVTATGSVQSRGAGRGENDNAIRIANHVGDSAITLSVATAMAFGTGAGAHAIHVEQAARGSVSITVSGRVVGGSSSSAAAIRTQSSVTAGVALTLDSGASVGLADSWAVLDGDTDFSAVVNAGAEIRGDLDGGGGTDRLTFKSGASGALGRVDRFETLSIGSGAFVSIAGSATAETLSLSGTLDITREDSVRSVAVGVGGFVGGGGVVALNADFADGESDRLVIAGNAIGAARLDIGNVGELEVGENGRDRPIRIDGVVEVGGSVSAGAFSMKEVLFDAMGYRLEFNAAAKRFDLVRFNRWSRCKETLAGSGVFVCSGPGPITELQNISVDSATDLTAILIASASVDLDTDTPAFTFDQHGAGGIAFTQSPDGNDIAGPKGAVRAHNRNGGNIAIALNGHLRKTSESSKNSHSRVVDVVNESGGGSVSLNVGSVTNARFGEAIKVVNHGSGTTHIMATGEIHAGRGSVTGTGDGIYVSGSSHSASSKSLNVTVGTVSGQFMGMRLAHRGGGNVSVTATGSIQGRGVNDNAIRIANHTGDSAIALSVATVAAFGTGAGAHAIHVEQAAQGRVSVAVANGAIVSAVGGGGVYLMNRGAGSVTLSAATVSAQASDAVRVVNHGSGTTRIMATGEIHAGRGSVTGAGDGIHVSGNSHSAASKSLSVTVGAVSGIYMGMRLAHRGGGNVSVTATGSVQSRGVNGNAIRITNHTGDSAIALSVATVAAFGTGAGAHGIHVDQAAQGSVHVAVADGAIASATGGFGVYLMNRGAGAVRLSVGTVTARARDAVRIVNRGSAATRIMATGEIHAGRGIGAGAGDGIAVSGDSHSAVSKSLSVTVGTVSGKFTGMRLDHRGGGNVSVTATGSVQGSGENDNAIRIANHTGDSAIALSVATAMAFGAGAGAHGIHVEQAARGSVSITVSGRVAGGRSSSAAAIRTRSSTASGIALTLDSGASVGSTGSWAVLDGDTDFSAVVNAGAEIRGNLDGGGGTNRLTFKSGASGALGRIERLETLSIESGAIVSIAGNTTAATLSLSGTLDISRKDSLRSVTVGTGGLVGGGVVALNADFADGGSDRLVIAGDATGTTSLDIGNVGELEADEDGGDRPIRIDGVVEVGGSVSAGAFSIGEVAFDAIAYRLEFNAAEKRFDLVRFNRWSSCDETSAGSGVFVCSGPGPLTELQSIGADSATDLSVTLNASTSVDTTTDTLAFDISQSGTGGIAFTQSATGASIAARRGVIRARNWGGGAISIQVTGSLTAGRGNAIRAQQMDGSGGSITIVAEDDVIGTVEGITALANQGIGSVSINAAGEVRGDARAGIYGTTSASGGALTVTAAASVTGVTYGVRAVGLGSGTVSVKVSGQAKARREVLSDHPEDPAGILVSGGANATGVKVDVASATGLTGMRVSQAGSGMLTVSASGDLTGTKKQGLLVRRTSAGGVSVSLSGSVVAGTTAISAVEMLVLGGDAAILSLRSGAAIGSGAADKAISEALGNASVTVNTGATVAGKINLGSGMDSLAFVGGTFSDVTEMQGGGGADTLRFSKGSGTLHATVVSEGLKGWESVIVESGATIIGPVTLAGDSRDLTFSGADIGSLGALAGGSGDSNTLAFAGVSGTIDGAGATGWENVSIEAGSSIGFGSGAQSISTGRLSVASGATLDVGNSDVTDILALTGDFEGGGTIAFDVDFTTGASDRLLISGNAAGRTALAVNRIGTLEDDTATNRPSRIYGVITVGGSVAKDAFTLGDVMIGPFGYKVEYVSGGRSFNLVRFFRNSCKESSGTPGAFTCSGTVQIGEQQTLGASGGRALSVTLGAEVFVRTSESAFVLAQPGSAGITLVQSASGREIRGADDGIVAHNTGGGAISITVTGSVTADAGDGIRAADGAGGGGIAVLAADVSGARRGIAAFGSGTGGVSVRATGAVSGAGSDGVGVHGLVAGDADLEVSVATATGGAVGISAVGLGEGAVSVASSGRASATARGGIGIRAVAGAGSLTVAAADVMGFAAGIHAIASGTDDVAIRASGHVAGVSGDGILVERSERGRTSISVFGTVTGGSGTDAAAIRTDAGSGSAVGISLGSGASVGSGSLNAIIGSAGDTSVTVNTGAAIAGAVKLGGGADRIVFDGGAFVGATEIDGGSGSDTLTFRSGSGTLHASVVSEGLKGWESVIVESGAALVGKIALAEDSGDLTFESGSSIAGLTRLDGGGGSDNTLSFSGITASLPTAGALESLLTGWETLVIGSGSTLRMGAGASSLSSGTLRLDGTLDAGANVRAGDSLRFDGNFVGGGTVILNANFVDGGSDSLTITGSATGTTGLVMSPVGNLENNHGGIDRPARIGGVVKLGGSALSSAFSMDPILFGSAGYKLAFDSVGRSFDLVRFFFNECRERRSGSGVFTCAGAGRIGDVQSLSASGTTSLVVRVYSEALIRTDGAAFALAQTGGSGGISFTQSATDQEIRGATDGVVARNTGGGSISLNVNGSVTGGSGDGLRAYEDASGTGISINVASAVNASGARSGIVALSSGTGDVTIHASGQIAGGSGDGIFVERSGSGSTRLSVFGTVTGGSGTGVAAIRTDVGSGSVVGISLRSGASVGSGSLNAIIGSAGNTSVTVNTGAAITGKVRLGAGADALVFDGGAFGSATEIDGGAGSDTLTFRSGSGTLHATVASKGLKGWESIIVESGAALAGEIRLAEDSGNLTFESGASVAGLSRIDGGGGSDNTLSFNGVVIGPPTAGKLESVVTGWETLVIGSGSTVRIGVGAWSLSSGTLRLDGTLDAGANARAGDILTLSDNFSGSGTVILNANFIDGAADSVRITGDAVGSATVSFVDLGNIEWGGDDENRPKRISDVITVDGAAAAGAFSAAPVLFGPIGYKLAFDSASRSFDLVRFFTNACTEARPGSGVFACAGTSRIGDVQSLSASGSTPLVVRVNSEARVRTDGAAFALAQTGGSGGISFTQSATDQEIRGATAGVVARNTGGGSISLNVNGSVTGGSGDGLRAYEDASGTGISITVASAANASGARSGIVALSSGTGDVTIHASGQIAGGSGDGIFVERGGGSTRILVSGTVAGGSGTAVAAIRTDVGSGNAVGISLRSGASVGAGSLNAIVGSGGDTTVTVHTGAAITGKVRLGAGADALVFDGGVFGSVTEMDGGAGSDTLTFRSGSGTLHVTVASEGLKGWESVIVESGAAISGEIRLADDSGDLTFESGSSIAGLTRIDGGGGTDNTLSFNGVAVSLPDAGAMDPLLTGWETLVIGTGSTLRAGAGAWSVSVGTLRLDGTLDAGANARTNDVVTLSGNFAGGGTVVLDANFAPGEGASDRLVITGDATGRSNVVVNQLGSLDPGESQVDRPLRIDGVISVSGRVSSAAFSSANINYGTLAYQLMFDETNKRFDLVRMHMQQCVSAGTAGAFKCGGMDQIGMAQSLAASGTVTLQVTLNARTWVHTDGIAFALTQTGGNGGIAFTQSATGQAIRGVDGGIAASNMGGGAIAIDVNGTVSGVRGHGLRAEEDSSGAGIAIIAAGVSGGRSGLMAVGSGTGSVSVSASGSVTGVTGEGIYARTFSGSALTVAAATVTGGWAGIKAIGGGAGAVSVTATGAVTGIGGAGMEVVGEIAATGVTVKAATVTGRSGIEATHRGAGALNVTATGKVTSESGDGIFGSAAAGALTISAASVSGGSAGIRAVASGTGQVTISASGDVAGTLGDGIFVERNRAGSIAISVSGAVDGGAGADLAAIRTNAPSGSSVTISINSGASVGSGSRNAIKSGVGGISVIVGDGAEVAGKIVLGSGTGTLEFAGGEFSEVTEMQGGAGDDTLRFSGGSGSLHATIQSEGLKGWERVVVESGATLSGGIRLASDSASLTLDETDIDGLTALVGGGGTLALSNVSGSIVGSSTTGWGTISVMDGSTIGFGEGDHSVSAGTLAVNVGGTVDVGRDSDTSDTLSVSGDFAGGGDVTLNANFIYGTSDTLAISGNATGSTTLSIGDVGISEGGLDDTLRPARIDGVVTVGGSAASSAFTSGLFQFGEVGYRLEFDQVNRSFDLVRFFTNICAESSKSGVFVCAGIHRIGSEQSLSTRGSATLDVTLNSETPVDSDGTAFALIQSGAGGIVFTQSANGQAITGAASGIAASSSGGGAVSIRVNGTVAGAGGTGIRVKSDAGGIDIAAADVSGSVNGIEALGSGTGAVSVRASGKVTGATGDGIAATAQAGGAVAVVAASVTGGRIGIAATGGAAVSVEATGVVTGAGTAGIRAIGGQTATSVTVDAATVAGWSGISARLGGTGALRIRATGSVTGTGDGGIGIYGFVGAAAGPLTITAAAVSGGSAGIRAVGGGARDVLVRTTGAVSATGSDGVGLDGRVTGAGGLAITAADVSGAAIGIRAVGSGTGGVSVDARGAVVGVATAGIVARGGSAASGIAVKAASVTGASGIDVRHRGTGALEIRTRGDVIGSSAVGIYAQAGATAGSLTIAAADVSGASSGIMAVGSGLGGLTISAAGNVTGSSADGIFAKHAGSGSTEISVSGAVTGGSGSTVAAIRTDTSGAEVRISLASGAMVGSDGRNAIVDGAGSATVVVGAGAAIRGAVKLGGGADRLLFDGGAFSSATQMDGGAGQDTLRFSKGSGSLHATLVSEGLKGWESVLVESGATLSGAIRLAADSRSLTLDETRIDGLTILDGGGGAANALVLKDVSGTLDGSNLTGWETIGIGAGSAISFGAGAHGLSAGALSVEGTLKIGGAANTIDTLTLSGNFAGGGTLNIDANFTPNAAAADRLAIAGNATGVTFVRLNRVDEGNSVGADRPDMIEGVVTVSGSVTSSAFISTRVNLGDVTYELEFDAENRRFDLIRTFSNKCGESPEGSGVFTCSGTHQIGSMQSLSGRGDAPLNVTLNSETSVSAGGGASSRGGSGAGGFTLTHSGTGGITFTQRADGKPVMGAESGIVATNSGGGAVRIDVNGSVTGGLGDGIEVSNDAQGAGITITAASVSGSQSGIRIAGSGTGGLSVMSSGTVIGAEDAGIDARTASGGALAVIAATVTGGEVGIRAIGSGAGVVSVTATGAVTGGANAGIVAIGGSAATGVSVSAATVTGRTGIVARHRGTGALDILASGSVTGTGADGFGIHGVTSSAAEISITAAAVTGGAFAIKAVGSGTGAVSVKATGMAAGTGAGATGVYARASGGGALSVAVMSATGGAVGVEAVGRGSGDVRVSVADKATGESGVGVHVAAGTGSLTVSAAAVSGSTGGIRAVASGAGAVSISASGSIRAAAGDGILVKRSAGGSTSISVSSIVSGGGESAAIRTDAPRGSSVSVSLASGALVGTAGRKGIVDGDADATVTVNSGARVLGSVSLGAGADEMVFAGGAFSLVSDLDGGTGSDTLTFGRGRGGLHQAVIYTGLKGWESIVVESGAALEGSIKLADDSGNLTINGSEIGGLTALEGGGGPANTLVLDDVSGTITGASATGWETVVIGSESRISFGEGVQTLTTGTLRLNGTLDLGDDSDTSDSLSLTGNFAGGGTVVLNANFATGGSDSLVITGAATGTTALSIRQIGRLGAGDSNTDRPLRIGGVVTVAGAAARSAFSIGEDIVFGQVGYRLEFNEGEGSFDLVRFFTNKCEEASPGSGVFACGGANPIMLPQVSDATGTTPLNVTLDSETSVNTDGAAISLSQTGGSGGIVFTQSAGGREIRGEVDGISARNTGGGAISISVSGTVTGGNGDGIRAVDEAGGAGAAISAAGVSGARDGIAAVSRGSGAVSISAAGSVTGLSGRGIYARTAQNSSLEITATRVTGGTVGVRARGGGAVSVTTTGAVSGAGTAGMQVEGGGAAAVRIDAATVAGNAGIIAVHSGSGLLSIVARGSVTGRAADGILAQRAAAGDTRIAVFAAVSGGTGSGAAAIRTDAAAGSSVEILLGSGASVGAGVGNAVVGDRGDTELSVGAGAAIAGAVRLGPGSDELRFSGGAFSSVTEMDGGTGNDVLRFAGGSGSLHPSVVRDGLKGWERVVVESGASISGAIKLASSSKRLTLAGGGHGSLTALDGGGGALEFRGVSASLAGTRLSNWESVTIDGGSSISFGSGTHSLATRALSVQASATLGIGAARSAGDTLTVKGDFSGSGTVALDVNFVSGATDRLVVEGAVTGATSLSVNALGSLGAGATDIDRPLRIDGVINVAGSASSGAFSLSDVTFDGVGYRLDFNAASRRFDLVRFFTNKCERMEGGAFACGGTGAIGAEQTLAGDGNAPLAVDLDASTTVDTDGNAFTLTQSGEAGITFTQGDGGAPITGTDDGIRAENSGGGAVMIAATGRITAGNDGVSASGDASGTSVYVSVAEVAAGGDGVSVSNSGTGSVSVTAAGPVRGDADGIRIYAGDRGMNVSVSAGSVAGGFDGVAVENAGAGAVVIRATGAVTGRSTGIRAVASGTGMTVVIGSSARVEGSSKGVDLRSTGGRLDVDSSGPIAGRQGEGMLVIGDSSGTDLSVRASAPVSGDTSGIYAKNRGSGATVVSAGSVTGGADGIRLVGMSGDITVTASGAVVGGSGDGIRARGSAGGSISVSVSDSVSGGAAAGGAAISAGGAAVTRITLESGATVRAAGNGAAILDGAGAATVTARSGSSIHGAVRLGAGADELVLAGGDFEGITELAGGAGRDTLRLTSGSGTLAAAVDFESVVIVGSARLEGDVRLGESARELVFADGAAFDGVAQFDGGSGGRAVLVFRGVSGELDASSLSSWKTVEIDQGSRVVFDGPTLEAGAVGALSLKGAMAFGSVTSANDVFTVEGDFSGGGSVDIDVDLVRSSADRLEVAGDVTGTTAIVLNNLTPGSLRPSGGAVDVVVVEGEVEASAFRLEGDAVSYGAFVYDLDYLPGDGKFVLRPGKDVGAAGAALRSAFAVIAGGFAKPPSLAARTRARSPASAVGAGIGTSTTFGERGGAPVGQESVDMAGAPARTVWMRFHSDRRSFGENGAQAEFEGGGFQFGMDLFEREGGAGRWIGGLTAQYGSAKAESKGVGGIGRQNSAGGGLGAALSWLGHGGFYADAQAQLGMVESDYSADGVGVLKEGVQAKTALAGVEIGLRIAAGARATLVPQGQISWSRVDADGFTSEDESILVSSGTFASSEARLGLAAEFALPRGGIRVSGNYVKGLSESDGPLVNERRIERTGPDGWAEIGIGGSLDMSENMVLFLDGTWRAGVGDEDESSGASASGGLKINW